MAQIDSPLRLTAEDRVKAVQNAKPVAEHVEHIDLTQAAEVNDTQTYKDIETVALVVSEPKADFELCPIILDEVRPDEVLIEMKYSGICHTDIVLQQGLLPMVQFPAIFGHEGAGTVRAIGSDVTKTINPDLRVGDSALLSFNTCGSCKPCTTTGHPAFCHNHPEVNHRAVRLGDGSTPARRPAESGGESVRSQYFGQSSFSRMSVVSGKCVVKCPPPPPPRGGGALKDDDDMAVYAPIGCGFQTGAGTVLNVLKPGKEDSVVIFGLGSVGLAALMAAKYMGAGQIVAVDIVDEKLAMAKELGATDTVNSLEAGKSGEGEGGGGVVGAVKKVTGDGKGGNFAIDCTGIPRVIEDMIECLAPEGTAALVGVPPAGAQVKIDPLTFLLQNKKFAGVIEGDSNPPEFIPRLIEMHRAGHFPIDRLCKTYPVANLKDAIRDMHAGKVIKPVIDWS